MTQNLRCDAGELALLSRLFTYPETLPAGADMANLSTTLGEDACQVDLMALQGEYVRLFINALPEVPCPPYGSFYLEGILMGESTVKLKKLYASYGWQTDEMADHIAVELEFMALLTALGPDGPIQEDCQFVRDHLNAWAPAFLDQVAENDRSGFYGSVSRYAKKILCSD
jgi:TorA maturation chaperone TorD